jgi:hypothetical protein
MDTPSKVAAATTVLLALLAAAGTLMTGLPTFGPLLAITVGMVACLCFIAWHLEQLKRRPRWARAGVCLLVAAATFAVMAETLKAQWELQHVARPTTPPPSALPVVSASIAPSTLAPQPPGTMPLIAQPTTTMPQSELFRDYVALHPTRRSQVIASLRSMADVFNRNRFYARVVFVQDETRAMISADLKGLFQEAGLRTNPGMGTPVMGAE